MDYVKTLKEQVLKKYEELQTYSTTYNIKAKAQRDKLMNEHKDAFKNDPNSVDVNAIAKDMFYLNGFYQADIRKLQVQLLDIYNFSKDIAPELEFPKELDNTITILKGNLPGQMFIVVDGNFEEIEKGKVDSLTADFEKKGYYKIFEEQVKKALNA